MPKIMIDISNSIYKRTIEKKRLHPLDRLDVGEAIVNGIVLPDNARFINADEILEHSYIEEDEEGVIFTKKWYCIEKSIFDNAKVVFDTFKEKENAKDND